MAKRDIVVIGGSMGASKAIEVVLAGLRPDFAGSIFICTHVPAQGLKLLAGRLSARSPLPVSYAEDGEPIASGRVYLPTPDRHLVVVDGKLRHGAGPRENMVRPSIDPLFRSVAGNYGNRAVGVILTGMLNDGASGLEAVVRCGGASIVQDPDTAEAPDMPRAACRIVAPDYVAAPEQIPDILNGLALEDAPPVQMSPPKGLWLEVEIALGQRLGSRRLRHLGVPAPLTCPNCDGVLSEIEAGLPLRFRCQTGHAFTAEVLRNMSGERVEEAMRIALRLMEERAVLTARMAEEARVSGRGSVAALYEDRHAEYEQHAEALREAAITLMQTSETPAFD